MSPAEKKLLIALADAVLNIGYHVARSRRDTLAKTEIENHLIRINQGLREVGGQ